VYKLVLTYFISPDMLLVDCLFVSTLCFGCSVFVFMYLFIYFFYRSSVIFYQNILQSPTFSPNIFWVISSSFCNEFCWI